MDYIKQLNRAINYIEEHLDDELIIDNISKEAGISRWHFQRVFKAVLGETIKEYTLNRRLSTALSKLLNSTHSILQISIECGFESNEVFTRAFKRTYSITPTEFRSNPCSILASGKRRITVEYIQNLHQGELMEAKIITLSEMITRGFSEKVNHVHSEGFPDNLQIIPKIWSKLRNEIGNSTYQKLSTIDENLNYFAGVIVRDEDDFPQLEKKVLPSGEYAEFIHRGPMSQIEHTMDFIYGVWFPQSGRKRRAGPDLSMHTEKTNPVSLENEIRILIPIL
jgi:AraC family transcriptional regulator